MNSNLAQTDNRPHVKTLNPEVARKIAAGEVIDRPCAIVRELMDNAVDSGADSISVEITGGGIEKIRIVDNGVGMTKEDLASCARPHATSKITTETDLLHLSTLGFRGEALSSMAAVSRLEITSGGWKMNASVTEDHLLTPVPPTKGTIVQTAALFENFPARRIFLKRPASETMLCRTMFEEKVLPRPDIAFSLTIDGDEKSNLPKGQTLVERFTEALNLPESKDLFYEIGGTFAGTIQLDVSQQSDQQQKSAWSFRLVIGEPSVTRDSRKQIFIYVNGRRIQEYSLMQAIEYGCQGYFPNGLHPVACLFVTMDSSLVDFNIHPAKREARFKDIAPLHHSVSTTVRDFFKQYTVRSMLHEEETLPQNETFSFEDKHLLAATPADDVASLASTAFQGDDYSPAATSFTQTQDRSYRDVHRATYNEDIVRFDDTDRSSDTTYDETPPQDMRSSFFGTGSEKHTNVHPETTARSNSIKNKEIDYSSTIKDTDSFHFIGSALGTFLIAEKNDTLYIIDQHAADERLRYNALMEKGGERQTLLVPYTVTTTSDSDDRYLEEIHESLTEAGFTCKNCGNGTWEFSSVPIRWTGTETDLAHDLLDKRINPKEIINAIAATTACRSAVKDGTVLDTATASRIAAAALSLRDPHCPHGRPIYTSITREQLFSLVKRT
jgi:DNA mismatch repair protein MutL